MDNDTSRYTKFYKTMLILSTIGTSFSLYSLLRQSVSLQNSFDLSIINGVLVIANYAIVAVSVAALILLWHKEVLGIKLKLSAYAATIVSSIVMLFIAGPTIDKATSDLREQLEGQEGVTQDMIDIGVSLVEPMYFIGLSGTIAISLLFAHLWWRAWKHQLEHDKNNK